MIPFDVFTMFKSLQLHFNSTNYDYFRYSGKRKLSIKKFDESKEKYIFLNILKKYQEEDIEDFFVSNLFENPKIWTGDLLLDTSDSRFLEYKKTKNNLSYIFKNDIKKLSDFQYSFKIIDGQNPPVLNMVYQKEITVNTFLILDGLLNFFDSFDNKLYDNIIWPTFSFKCKKLKPFIKYDKETMIYDLKKEIKIT